MTDSSCVLVLIVLDYYLAIWGNLAKTKYERLDNLTLKLAKKALPKEHFKYKDKCYHLEKLNWLSSKEGFEYYLLTFLLIYSARETSYTKLIKSIFLKTDERHTQVRTKYDILLLPIKTEYRKNVYYNRAIKLWNSLPIKCQESSSVKEFDFSLSNLIVKSRSSNNEYHNEDRIINRFFIRDFFSE